MTRRTSPRGDPATSGMSRSAMSAEPSEASHRYRNVGTPSRSSAYPRKRTRLAGWASSAEPATATLDAATAMRAAIRDGAWIVPLDADEVTVEVRYRW